MLGGCSGARQAGGLGHCLAGAAARGDVEALQHPAEDGVREQVCEERGELEQLGFSQAPLKEKHVFKAQKSLFPWRLWGPAPAVLLLTGAQWLCVGVGAEADDGPLGGQVAGAAMGEGTLAPGEEFGFHPG